VLLRIFAVPEEQTEQGTSPQKGLLQIALEQRLNGVTSSVVNMSHIAASKQT
jgi:hypothetical protein